MINEIELDEINKALYEDAKIYWIPNKNYSSKLFERMMQQGYEMRKSGKVSFMVDLNGHTIASGFSKIDFLQRLAYMMQ